MQEDPFVDVPEEAQGAWELREQLNFQLPGMHDSGITPRVRGTTGVTIPRISGAERKRGSTGQQMYSIKYIIIVDLHFQLSRQSLSSSQDLIHL